MTKKPNVVLIMADQIASQFLPFRGRPIVKTPILQRLRRKGVAFYTGLEIPTTA